MRKIILFTVLMISLKTFAQPGGFETNQRVDAKVGDDTVLTVFGNYFAWDKTGSFTQQSTLYSDIDLSSYDLLSANLIFTDKEQAQKVVFAPFRLSSAWGGIPFLANIRVNLALKDKITTLGFALGGDNSVPMSKRARKIAKEEFERLKVNRPRNPEETFAEYEKHVLNEQKDSVLDKALHRYDKRRMQHVFKWSIGYNSQLFPVLFASGQVNEFDSLNYYGLKSHSFSGSATYAYANNQIVLTGSYNYILQRASAAKEQKLVPYYGPAVGVSARIVSFVKKSELPRLEVYRKSLFIPAIHIGLSWEGKFADDAIKYHKYYQDKIQKVSVYTPYFDILITPAAQFRIGLPINKTIYVNGTDQLSTGATLQYNLKLSNLG